MNQDGIPEMSGASEEELAAHVFNSTERSYAHGFLPPSHTIFGTVCSRGSAMSGSIADGHKNRL